MAKICDHTSVAMFIWKDGKLLLIERGKIPFGFALPAGHTDGDKTFEEAAKRELEEEVGLKAVSMKKILEIRKENPCRREGGTWHLWKLYEVSVEEGEIKRSLDETKRAGWYSKEEIEKFAKRTEEYQNGRISEEEWRERPGLEPVMLEFFRDLKIVKQ